MTEMEMDAVVACLVPEYESMKLKAIIARQEFLFVANIPNTDRRAITDARERWEELEDGCTAILQHIDALAELNAV